MSTVSAPTRQQCWGCCSAHILPTTGWLGDLERGTVLPSACVSSLWGDQAGFGMVPRWCWLIHIWHISKSPCGSVGDSCLAPASSLKGFALTHKSSQGDSSRSASVLQSSSFSCPQITLASEPHGPLYLFNCHIHILASLGPWHNLERRENLLAVRPWFPEAPKEQGESSSKEAGVGTCSQPWESDMGGAG